MNNTLIQQKFSQLSFVVGYPDELKAIRRWMPFKLTDRPNGTKKNKVPQALNANGTLSNGQKNNPEHYLSFDTAIALFKSGKCDGIGIVLPTGITCIDVDDDYGGELSAMIQSTFGETTGEVSYSGNGIHYFIKATRKGKASVKSKDFFNGQIEILKGGSFVALSGKHNGIEMIEAQAALNEFTKPLEAPQINLTDNASVSSAVTLSSDELQQRLKLARLATNGKKFSDLFDHGRDGETTDKSALDLALCNLLAFWLDRCSSSIDKAFRQSKLFREKWERDDYRNNTISMAIADCKKTFGGLAWYDDALAALSVDEFCRACQSASNSSLTTEGWEQRNERLLAKIIALLNVTHPHVNAMVGASHVYLVQQENSFAFRNPREYENHNSSWFINLPEARGAKVVVKRVDIIKLWKESLEHVKANGVTYLPCAAGAKVQKFDKGKLNLFCGWGVQPDFSDAEFTRAQLFLDFMKDVLCNGNHKYYQFLVNSLSQWVQYPQEKSGVAIVLQSPEKGTGKSTFVDILRLIFGEDNFTQIGSKQALLSDFNDRFATCLLCSVEEAVWGGDKAAEGTIKNLITSPVLTINKKFMAPFNIDNHTRFVYTSNDNWVIPASNDERRYFVLKVSTVRQKDNQYFATLRKAMQNGGAEQVLGYLSNLDISNFDARVPIQTDALRNQMQESLKGFSAFMQDVLSTGGVKIAESITISLESDANNMISKSNLHDAYIDYNKKHYGGRYPVGKASVKQELYACGIPFSEKKHIGIKGNRVMHWCFPSLEEMRAAFTEKTNLAADG